MTTATTGSAAFLSLGASFKQVTLVNQTEIPVDSFLEATETLIRILESLGTAVSPVKSDMQGNVNVPTEFFYP